MMCQLLLKGLRLGLIGSELELNRGNLRLQSSEVSGSRELKLYRSRLRLVGSSSLPLIGNFP
jgi:hypothetical protein